MAPSSSARKVAKLASRGKGKKVRFSGGTTFPAVITAVCVAMIALVAYAKLTVPGEETGAPQPTDAWSIAYGIKVCDEWLPNLTGTADELTEDASTGDLAAVNDAPDRDGIIHYHAQAGGNTGKKARLGVFLDVYDIKLSNDKLELPESQVGAGERRVWDIDKDDVFDGTSCEGDEAVIKVRVWNDYTTGEFVDNVTAFRSLRFTNNGMVFAIAVVPADDNDFEIDKPASAAKLEELGVIGEGSAPDSTVPSDTTGDTTVDTTADTTVDTTSDTTADTTDTSDAATTTTGG